MQSSQELFSLEYSSSEEEFEEQTSRFNIEDLPILRIPSPFQSDTSGCDSPTSPESYISSRPETPTTPLSPDSSFGGEFAYINISSQTICQSQNPSWEEVCKEKGRSIQERRAANAGYKRHSPSEKTQS